MTDSKRDPIEAAQKAYNAAKYRRMTDAQEGADPMQAALQAYLDAIAPDWRLVPVKPTAEMACMVEPALDRHYNGTKDASVESAGLAVFAALVDMAPAPPGLSQPQQQSEGER